MGSVMRCPETGEPASFNIKTDAKSVAHAWNQFIHAASPHCRENTISSIKKCTCTACWQEYQDDLSLVLIAKAHRPEWWHLLKAC